MAVCNICPVSIGIEAIIYTLISYMAAQQSPATVNTSFQAEAWWKANYT